MYLNEVEIEVMFFFQFLLLLRLVMVMYSNILVHFSGICELKQ